MKRGGSKVAQIGDPWGVMWDCAVAANGLERLKIQEVVRDEVVESVVASLVART